VWMPLKQVKLNTAILWSTTIHCFQQLGWSRSDSTATIIRDFGICLDSDVAMKSHITKTMLSCLAVLRKLRSIHVPVLDVISCLLFAGLQDYSNATLASIPSYFVSRLPSVMNNAARLIFSSSRFDHMSLRSSTSFTG